MLSVIVPNYNNSRFLSDCIESILAQTFRDFEIIIADDKSEDDSYIIIDNYLKKYPGRIRAIFNKKNVGVSRNRHNAIIQSSGEFITTIDGDDFFYSKTKLESEMNLINSYKHLHGEDIIAFSNTINTTRDKIFINRRGTGRNIKQGKILNHILARNCEIPLDFTMKKSIYYEAGGYKYKYPIYEDWDLKIRLAAKYRFFYTGQDGTAYRHHGQGLSSADYGKHIYWLWKIFTSNMQELNPASPTVIWILFLTRLLRIALRGNLKKYPRLLNLADQFVYG